MEKEEIENCPPTLIVSRNVHDCSGSERFWTSELLVSSSTHAMCDAFRFGTPDGLDFVAPGVSNILMNCVVAVFLCSFWNLTVVV